LSPEKVNEEKKLKKKKKRLSFHAKMKKKKRKMKCVSLVRKITLCFEKKN
jgi:hypothetical protein